LIDTARQEGLVNQELVSSLRVAVMGDHPILLSALESVASHLGVRNFPWSGDKPDHVLLLDDTVSGDKVFSRCTRILLLDDGVRITDITDNKGGTPSDIQLPGLAMIGASLGFQEVLRQNRCIRRIDIVKSHISINYRINSDFSGDTIDFAGQFSIKGPDGETVPFHAKRCTDDSGHISLSARIESNQLAESLLREISLTDIADCRGEEDRKPSVIEVRIPRQDGGITGTCVVAGVGGLGSWALHSISQGVSNFGSDGYGLELVIIDPDIEIETHNLNRQVLYSEVDVGSPKALAASTEIRRRLPMAETLSGVQELGMPELEMFINGHTKTSDSEFLEEDLGISLSSLPPEILHEALGRADVILSCVDNLRARTIISALSEHLHAPMINAGAGGWSGQMDIFHPKESCMVCRYGPSVGLDSRVQSCQEDGEIPFSSIVTSTAIFGSLQGLAALARLSVDGDLLGKWPDGFVWGGRWNKISSHANTFHLADKGKSHLDHLLSALLR
jgi:molybdopterin/thiamine biosynthesis adenylyltransferase